MSESKIMHNYRDLVKKGRDQFKKELESIKPEVILRKKGTIVVKYDYVIEKAHLTR